MGLISCIIIFILLLLVAWRWSGLFAWPTRSILVIFSFTDNDEQSYANLLYFISEAIEGDQRADYVIVVRYDTPAGQNFPKLPPHARYIKHDHPEECISDWGAYAAGLTHSRDRHRTFIFISSSARGPFLPSYAKSYGYGWADPFLQQLQKNFKLVGPTISCQGSRLNDAVGRWRGNPYVEPYAVATDREGLKALIEDGEVFKCHQTRWEESYFGDLGASAAILAAGYNLDSFITKYQGGIDWRDKARWECNQRASIHGEFFVDGVTLDPLVVMFVKVSTGSLVKEVSSAVKAEKYTRWLREAREGIDRNITANEHQDNKEKFRIPKVLEMKARGSSCFDAAFYLESDKSADLRMLVEEGKIQSEEDLWQHFVNHGQFEARPFRFSCPIY